jgi:hypothetical protein
MRPRRRGFPRGFRGRGAEDHENQLIQSQSGVNGDFLGPECCYSCFGVRWSWVVFYIELVV